MDTSKHAFQAGLFILVAIAGAIAMIAMVAQRQAQVSGSTYKAEFATGQDISGLVKGAEVRLLGVKVGRVDRIEVVTHPELDTHVHVAFTIEEHIALREGTRIESQAALTGGGWLNILSTGEGQALPEDSIISARSANLSVVIDELRQELTTIAELAATELTQTADALEATANKATELIVRLDQEVDPVLEDYDAFITEATGVMIDVRSILGDSGEDIRQTLTQLNQISKTLDQRLPKTLDQVDLALNDIQSFTAEAAGFLTQAGASLSETDALIDELTGSAKGVNDLLKQNRPTIDRMVSNANRTIKELEGMVDDLRANPSRLVWPPDEKDLHNLGLYAAARSYADAAEDLQLAAAALQNASQDPETDAEELERLRQKLLTQFEHFDRLQNEVWQDFKK